MLVASGDGGVAAAEDTVVGGSLADEDAVGVGAGGAPREAHPNDMAITHPIPAILLTYLPLTVTPLVAGLVADVDQRLQASA